MQRSHTLLCILTAATACGSGPTGPAAAPTEPAEIHIVQRPSPPDAAIPDAPAAPKLMCEGETKAMPAPAPEPTWFCGRADGTRHGPFVTLFPDGSVEISGTYKDGKLDGAWQRHYPSGPVAEQGAFVSGQKDGKWRQLGRSGAVLGEYDMKAGTGTERRWYDDGPLYSERGLRAGVASGDVKIFEHDGLQVIAARYLGGKLDGAHLVGTKPTMRIEETFKHGIRQGARQIWQFWLLLFDENYDLKGKLDGAFTIWRDKKLPRVTGTYDHGKRTGTWTWFDRGNNKEREGDFADGKKTGAWFEWFENKLVYSGNFTDGKPDGEFVYYDKAGNELGRFELKDGTGWMITFHPNRQVATKAHMGQGELDGVYQEYTPKKKLVVEGHYYSDRKHGWWREWTETGVPTLEERWKRGRLDGSYKKFVDGKLSVETTYKDGKVDGAYTEYRNGKPAFVGQLTNDRRTGTWTEYDADGAVVMTATYKDGVLDGPWHQLVAGVVVEGQMLAGRRTGTWTRTDRAGVATATTYKTP